MSPKVPYSAHGNRVAIARLAPWLSPVIAAEAILDVVSQAPDVSVLKEGGRLASTIGAAGEGEGRFNIMAVPSPANLERLAELLDSGALRVSIQRSYSLEQAGEALQALPATHTRGKLSLTIA